MVSEEQVFDVQDKLDELFSQVQDIVKNVQSLRDGAEPNSDEKSYLRRLSKGLDKVLDDFKQVQDIEYYETY